MQPKETNKQKEYEKTDKKGIYHTGQQNKNLHKYQMPKYQK